MKPQPRILRTSLSKYSVMPITRIERVGAVGELIHPDRQQLPYRIAYRSSTAKKFLAASNFFELLVIFDQKYLNKVDVAHTSVVHLLTKPSRIFMPTRRSSTRSGKLLILPRPFEKAGSRLQVHRLLRWNQKTSLETEILIWRI
jgi:hypothetical protein